MRAARLDSPWVTALFGLGAAILTWNPVLVAPSTGLDASWILGLNLAAASGLDHGTQFVFTYGPLGFLEEPLVIDGLLATLSAIYLLALRAALAATLLYAARRSLPWPAAALAALAVTMIMPRGIVPLALVTVWCLVALQDPERNRAPRLLVIGGGALAGLELLVKLNVGITILLLVVIATLALPGTRGRNLATLLASFAAAFAVLWLAAGQGLGNIDDYVRSSFQVVSGYSEAMQVDTSPASWDWWAALLVGLASIGATALATRGWPWARRAAALAIVALLVFALEKYGFVRHDGGHVGAYFAGLAAVWVGLQWRGIARLAPCVATALIVLAYAGVSNELDNGLFRPRLAIDQLRTLLVPGERAEAREAGRSAMQSAYAVDPRIIDRIGDAPVDARPWEIGLIWAYDLDWRPLPLIQDYQAYTPELDRLDAEALASADGPEFLLRHQGYGESPLIGLDGRLTSFDSPQATLVMLCRFRPQLTTARYQLLSRGSDRCGEPRRLGTVTASYGEPVSVPAAGSGEAVFARIDGAGPTGVEQLRTLAYRAAIRHMTFDAGRVLLPPRNATSGLVLSIPDRADFPAPFGVAPDARTIAIDSEGGFATSDGPLEIEFFAVPIRPLSVPLD